MQIIIDNRRKTTPADTMWHDTIDELAVACAKTPGLKARIIKRMNKETPREGGKPWNRQQVESYLNLDKAKRFEPRLGAGLALIQSGKRQIEDDKAERKLNNE